MSLWDDFKMDEKITRILNVQSHEPDHHFGRPFLTPYQIAIKFENEYPEEFRKIGKPVGGGSQGRHDSLAQYIANRLSIRIQEGRIRNIEGRFLYRDNHLILKYKYKNLELEATSGKYCDLSLFRLIN